MTKMLLVKRKGGFFPADPVSEEYAAQTKEGAQVLAEVTKPRSPKQNRFIHSALHEVLKHTNKFRDIEDLKRYLKIRSRMYHVTVLPDGTVALEVPSIAFGSMDQYAFQRIWNRWKWIIINEILIGVDPEELQETILAEIA